ncbi:hypothetical protein BKA67DRAFT_127245 [Truncatella angustata]|uniref:Carrier domain-containing protein n=1 Tax=Truncatella angustata TaxID=152316 RepID=A0A9P8RIL1_9PEZI|nr:uncharacterized protein BKA67DRAFT_127245 [Truncatella angustata]KAH6645013.1 hypothetical protein BKA67DRAFT_127245 [Truncatella angustata]KAH8201063.1 hypothetical protein TruAng_004759 [Truncatella angustata]
MGYLEDIPNETSISPSCHAKSSLDRAAQQVHSELVTAFWKEQFIGLDTLPFPQLPHPGYHARADKVHDHLCEDIVLPTDDTTRSVIIRAAWATLLSWHSGSPDTTFGAEIGSCDATRSTSAVVPVRITVDEHTTAERLFERVQDQASLMLPFTDISLRQIESVSEEARRACQFQTLLVDQYSGVWARRTESSSPYAIILTYRVEDGALCLCFRYDHNLLDEQEVERLAHQFALILRQLSTEDATKTKLGDLDAASDLDLTTIWKWNAELPESVDMLVHHVFAEKVREKPAAPAVCAWDGDLTYGKLDKLSTKLSNLLINEGGLRPGMIVPLCFEKSMWLLVAVLGVMKAGGASVLLDVTLPTERLRNIVQQLQCSLILCSTTKEDLSTDLVNGKVFTVSKASVDTHQQLSWPPSQPRPLMDAESPLYVVFTSGSTGTPKGAIVTHKNFCSAIKYQQAALGYTPRSRVFDLTSYAFDVTWSNMLHALAAGACVCVPSEEGRSTADDIAKSIIDLRANLLPITPTVARMIDPKELPSIETVLFTGEVLARSDVTRWKSNNVKICNAYGPAECTVTSTAGDVDIESERLDPPSIGTAVGAAAWIVRPNTNCLAAIGTLGELWLEGPIVGGGYLAKPDKTNEVFVEDPEWLLRGVPSKGIPGRRGRLYRTGDMVRYDAAGTLFFAGRKDNQVKIRGQRVELGEIEHHVRDVLPNQVEQVVVEVITLDYAQTATLTMFFTLRGVRDQDLENVAAPLVADLQHKLVDRVPTYMIPTVFIPLAKLPMTASGKTDRRSLREMGASADKNARLTNKSSLATQLLSLTETERRLQMLWASVLQLNPYQIGVDDSFLGLGGDSIQAMRLVSAARKRGMLLTVPDIFRQSSLQGLSKLVEFKMHSTEVQEVPPPFSLIQSGTDVVEACRIAAAVCSVKAEDVEDIFPCTPLQEGLLAMTALSGDKYISHGLVELQPGVNITGLQEAWDKVSVVAPILRTRIVDLPGQGLVQVVLRGVNGWADSESIEEYRLGAPEPMGLGTELTRFHLVYDDAEHKVFLAWTQHHAVYDGWSLDLLQNAVEHTYRGGDMEPMPGLQPFVQYLLQSDKEACEAFWRKQFDKLEAPQYPVLPSAIYQPKADKAIKHVINNVQWCKGQVTPSTVIRTAWATVISRQCSSPDTVFGAVVLGRQAPVLNIERVAGPTIATVPIRVIVDEQVTVTQLLERVQNQSTEMILHEQTGLQHIRRISEETERGCRFQSLLVVQPVKQLDRPLEVFVRPFDDEDNSAEAELDGVDAFSTHAVTIICQIDGTNVGLCMHFDSSVIGEGEAERLLQYLEHAIHQLCQPDSAGSPIRDLTMTTDQDLRTIWSWNANPIEPVEACVHQLISQRAHEDPSAMAICAWDGEMSYGELDALSTSLAVELVTVGVKPGAIVPLCFEKSKWVPVAALAVMKAGGASVTMDCTQPRERLNNIAQQIGSDIILSGTSTTALASSISGKLPLIIDEESLSRFPLNSMPHQRATVLPLVKPTELLYIVFTSGSTGAPKGAMITHSNFATASRHHGPALGFRKTSRVADFASYAFDVSWANFLNTMMAGGCLCIPSEDDRKHDFVGFMSRFQVNYADLTPSVAAALDLNLAPHLKTVVVGGELVELDKFEHLQDLESLIITYGPAECTVTATAIDVRHHKTPAGSIGRACGSTTWIVHPEKQELVPIGSVGELVLEGPLNGLGYLGQPEKTSASLIDNPHWLTRGAISEPGRRGRVYRTGDLVRYHSDGSLIFVGRIDSQVKIRGQRVDLSEVELHVRQLLPSYLSNSVLAEVVRPQGIKAPILVIFYTIPDEENVTAIKEQFSPLLDDLERKLAMQSQVIIPPGAYIPIPHIPISATGKTDRRAVREYGASLDPETFSALSMYRCGERLEPVTAAEKKLQLLWSSVLGLDPSQISADDSFLRLGGDSIAAMRLASTARQNNVHVTVTEILKHPQLNRLAQVITWGSDQRLDSQQERTIEPFSLLHGGMNVDHFRRQAAELCSRDVADIEDLLPCTAMQEGLIALTAKRSGDYVQRTLLELQPDVDLDRFRSAWQLVYRETAILRTRIVHLDGHGLFQAVVRTPLIWKHSYSIDSYRLDERDEEYHHMSMSPGTPLTTFGIIDDAESNKRYFACTQHHATYDGWSLQLLYDAFENIYQKQARDAFTSFQAFIKHVLDQNHDDEAAYWKQQFAGLDAPQFPAMPSNHQPRANEALRHDIGGIEWSGDNVTPSSVVRAAWATLLSWYGASPDTVFGAVVLGRQAPVPDIEKLVGPTIATVPIRIIVDDDSTVQELLRQTQKQATEMIQFEQSGLQKIAAFHDDTQRGCLFQSLLVVQAEETSDDTVFQSTVFKNYNANTETNGDLDAFSTYAINLTCDIQRSGVILQAKFDSDVLSVSEVQRMLQQLEHILRQLCQPETVTSHLRMGDLSMTSEQDLETIWNWNMQLPDTVSGCVHHVFAERVSENPSAPAVSAWDGKLSYRQLDDLSTRLAHCLIGEGVGPGIIVPIYLEKSVWVPVAVLAVFKAGGAAVILDATLPVERLRGLVGQLSPVLLLTSATHYGDASRVTTAPTITVSESTLEKLKPSGAGVQLPDVKPSSPLYIVFTSGSTGQPKGVVVTHENFCSAIKHQQIPLGLEPTSRVFDFTSYAFDVAWSNILHTLTIGACLCIPSEEERMTDVAGSIARLCVDFVFITPTVANILEPLAVPGLKKIAFGGEALKRSDVERWASRPDVMCYNVYGPAECTVISTIDTMSPLEKAEISIGEPYGIVAWVVKPNANGLAAVGTAGELWIEGPNVGEGYLNNTEKTADVFVENPQWLLRGAAGFQGRRGRLYRTGDLVRYNPNGSLHYFGRRDTQVKIRGQRVELGEVEHHIRQLLPVEFQQIVSEVITPQSTKIPALAVFYTVSENLGPVGLDSRNTAIPETFREDLGKLVPAYMVPTVYIPLSEFPMTASGKTDRRALRDLGKSYSPPSIMELDEQPPQDSALTEEEAHLREIWAGLLNLDRFLIAPRHSFSALGGDSIKVMSLSMAIRRQWRLNIQVPRLLGPQDTLGSMAKMVSDLRKGQDVVRPTPMDLETELAALTNKLRSPLRIAPIVSKSTVLLTGATGFLGIRILQHLLISRAFERVVLLVRKTNRDSPCFDRVRDAAVAAGWWEERFTSPIEVWEGDLSADRLGLTALQWSSLCGVPTSEGVVNAIIHNGAAVHWSTDYEKLKAVNVVSTLQLLQAAIHSKALKRFVYISGGLDAGDWASPASGNVAKQATGYDISKHISERLVTAAASQQGEERSRFSIVKPGLIIGDSEGGVANPDDFLWRVVTTAIHLRTRPVEAPKAWLAVSDVASISNIVLHHATADDVDHFVELNHGLWVEDFWTAIESEIRQVLRPVSWDEWIQLAQESMAVEREAHPLWPVQQFLGALGGDAPDHVEEMIGNGRVEAAIRRNVRYLREMGLAGSGGAAWQQAASTVTMRARR